MTTPTDLHTETRSRSRRAIVVIGVVVPVTIAMAGAFVMALWIPELPNPVASHWTPSGPDGYTTVGAMIALPLVVTLLFSAFAAVVSWRGGPDGGLLRAQKVLVATSIFLATVLTLTSGGSLAIQRGLESAERAGNIGGVLAIAFIAASILALLSWFVLPPGEKVTSTRTVAEPIAASATERLYFASSTRLGSPVVAILLLVFLALAVTLIIQAVNNPDELIVPAVIGLVALVLATSTLSWRVIIDRHGIRVRSAFGWPRISIAPDQIASVAVVQIDPMGEFGGYGWRWDSQGRSGVVLSKGDAIEVTRVNGKRFVVTVHDASRGAAVLATIQNVERDERRPKRG
ncbi:hypothetical protein [Salinibacterium sp. TMP30]|uniref:hypothetical protein n=1 Tax=Salinibacterium sp. TMP30 TaxID=3138237 RepID=UPI003138DFE7